MPRKSKSLIPIEEIDGMIRLIRGVRVMLDRDLARIYGVPTKVFNQAVKRNRSRFPAGSYKQEESKIYTLQSTAETRDCIKSVRFDSDNEHLAAFSAVLIDDLTLWYAPEGACR